MSGALTWVMRRAHLPVASSRLWVTGARPFYHLMLPDVEREPAGTCWPDGAIEDAQLYSGDPLDAPDWIPAGSTVSLGAAWCSAFTAYVSREA